MKFTKRLILLSPNFKKVDDVHKTGKERFLNWDAHGKEDAHEDAIFLLDIPLPTVIPCGKSLCQLAEDFFLNSWKYY